MRIRSDVFRRCATVTACTLVVLLVAVGHQRGDKAEVINETSVRAHMAFLAGDALNGRGSGTRDEWIAATSFFTRSDNIQLARRGVIAQTVSSFGLHTDYHKVSDEVSTIDFAHMTDAIRSMLAPVRWLANSTFKPVWLEGMKPTAPAGRGRGGGPAGLGH